MDRNEKLKVQTRAKILRRLNRENTAHLGEDEFQNQGDRMRGNPTTVRHRIDTSVRNSMNGSAPVAFIGPFGGGGAAPASIPAGRAPSTQAPTPPRPGLGSSSPSQLRPGTFPILLGQIESLLIKLSEPSELMPQRPVYNSISSDDTAIHSATLFSPVGPVGVPQHSVMNISPPQHSLPNVTTFSPSGRPVQNPMVAALLSGQQPPLKARLQMDKNRRASVVKIASRQKPLNSSSPPIPSALRSVNSPPLSLESTTDESSSDELIVTNRGHPASQVHQTQSSMRMNIDPSFSHLAPPMSPNELFSAFSSMNTFAANNPPPSLPPNDLLANPGPAWNLDLLQSPQLGPILSPPAEIAVRVGNARALAHNGYFGPFDIGRLTCLIDPYTGEPNPIAETRPDCNGNMVTYDIHTNEAILDVEPCETGTAQWGRKGEFTGFVESSAASWVLGPG
ncbi:hypothetical protein JMJ77_0010459 [Colletotrichum scovillei]|uniref:Uncharacterized protein n=1 Tax=Colletotrichum scovillei TaxID=1209932 RepID=A0A9P7QUF4_9PEZI|nr:hypothetical protein JMJ78_0011870 [Colletotrichum scovillei]KAG7042359.1 hypothetical protein JMJ77_0010459 [Colletotrichum scovillei]KAG7062393.1 hypothetical protein JMJ76_0006668 [Colletotrichum scovillei]